MKTGVRAAALALFLGGAVFGQETVWRPVYRPPQPAATARGASPAGATLGRPVVLCTAAAPVTADPPRPFPPAYRHGAHAAARPTSGVEPIATVPPPGAVIAASTPATVPWTARAEEETPLTGDLFAIDRVTAIGPPPAFLPPGGPEPPTLGNWQGMYPVTPPVAEQAPPAAADFAADLPPTKWYVRGEYLLWWTKSDTAPPLLTTGDPNNPDAGSLGQPDTRLLFGGELRRNPFSGARFVGGFYLDDCGEKAVEVAGFFLAPRSDRFQANAFTNSVVTRPFLAANPGVGETVQQVSFPGRFTGQADVDAPSQLWGLEANVVCQWCCGCNWRIDPLLGFRYLNLRESLTVTEMVRVDLATSPLRGSVINVQDRFATRNEFYGAQVGVEARWQQERWTLDGRLKLAVGSTQGTVDIAGSQLVVRPDGSRMPFVGGLLALPSNIGSFNVDRFAVVPELSLSAGYYLTERLRAMVGYNLLYWSSVLRPGQQIDRVLDVNAIPNFLSPGVTVPPAPQARPVPLLTSTDFWAQGLTLGLEYRY